MHELLPLLPRPGRYLGIEEGAERLDGNGRDALRCALAFPDLYEVGMSYLGQKILYTQLNALPDTVAERVFAPCREAAELLRARNTPLATLESDIPLAETDCIGFSVTHELSYTNVLYMLDLAGIPLRSRDRLNGNWPLVLAGGGCTMASEPLAPFMDAMILGDGEEALADVVEVLRRAKQDMTDRPSLLRSLAHIPGVYVPEFFQAGPEGTQAEDPAIPLPTRRVVADLDTAPYPSRQVVPLGAVHNRLSLEIARGCTRGCRFCQAGMIYRPSRERSLGNLSGLMRDCLADTGFDEISFLSLSTGDFSGLRALFLDTADRCAAEQVSVALPSLRVGSIDNAIMARMAGIRRTGATLAPEAGSQRLRDVINKGVSEEDLIRHVQKLAAHGWQQVKLYFMIGLPTETDDDVLAILALSRKARDAAKQLDPSMPRLQITAAVSPFVPKAHTPFQWEAQINKEEIQRRVNLLRDAVRGEKNIKLRWHEPSMSQLEGILSRGDRRLANVLERAYRKGAIFCSWIESFNLDFWLEALEEEGLCVQEYTGSRDLDVPLPWEHLRSGLSRRFLLAERDRALRAALTPDCRYSTCHMCGVCETAAGPAGVAGGSAETPVRTRLNFAERDQADDPIPPMPGRPQHGQGKRKPQGTSPELAVKAVRYRVWHEKMGRASFISQLELQPLLERAMRRAGLPLAFSQGFHPLPLMSFGRALPVGVESRAEWFSITLRETLSAGTVLQRLQPCMLHGLSLIRAEAIPLNAKTVPAESERFSVSLRDPAPEALESFMTCWQDFAARAEAWHTFETKKGPQEKDIRPLVLRLNEQEAGVGLVLDWSSGYLSPMSLVRAVLAEQPFGPEQLRIVKESQELE